MIKAEKLSFSFTDKYLYKDVDFSIEAGQHCAIIGSNGTGKSTLVKLLHPENMFRHTIESSFKKPYSIV